MEERDAQIVSLSGQLGMEEYKQAPVPPETVRQFLSETSTRLREREERARQEKVKTAAL